MIPFLPLPRLRCGELAKSSFQNEGAFQVRLFQTWSAPSPKLCACRSLPASPLGWLTAPHAGVSPGLGPPAPAPVLIFPARRAHPDLPRAQGQNLCLSSSSLHGPSPKPFRPAPLPEETYHKDPGRTTTGILHRSEVWRDVAQPCVPRQNCPMFIAPLGSLHLTFLVRSHLAAIASSQDPLPA